ncbi:neurofilament medium polypeptide-like [Forsythia ovata]|uniref:Neurofilament medium polypeptide-like n=1 Tax=Forsythia ovata TaxID=205694 RepID=A0ABD1S873_9LAMI
MGEGDTVLEKPESVANGNAEIEEMEKKTEAVTEKKDGEARLEDDKDGGKLEAENMDVDKEDAKEGKEADDKVAEEGKQEEREETNGGKKEINCQITEDDSGEKPKEETENKAEGKVDGIKEETEDKAEEHTEDMEETEDKAEEHTVDKEETEDKAEEHTEDKEETEDKAEEHPEDKEETENKAEEHTEEKSKKKRPRTKNSAGKNGKGKKKEAEDKEKERKTPTGKKSMEPKTPAEKKGELKTPVGSTIERPVRERKSVERLVSIIEKDDSKEFQIEKGRGTALKDIPNVAYKLSRKKTEDTFKLLHTILFGRRGKAAQIKNNISRFSGFVWHDNEEKQMIKVKEKLDKFVKEKLVEFCDVLDIPISKANTRKEDIIAKLVEFLLAPRATTTELLAEKEQSSKGQKRKRVSKSASGSSTPSKGSAKSQKRSDSASKKAGEKNSVPESEDDSEEAEEEQEEAPKEENENRSESEDESGEEKEKQKPPSAKKGSAGKAKTKKVTISEKASTPKKSPAKSSSSRSRYNNDTSAKKSSGKKKDEAVKEKSRTPKTNASKESTEPFLFVSVQIKGRRSCKGKTSLRKTNQSRIMMNSEMPSCEILKDVDFNTATFTDILKLLAKRFSMDLTPRKSSIKLMIQDELTKLADGQDDEEEDEEGNTEKDEKQAFRPRRESLTYLDRSNTKTGISYKLLFNPSPSLNLYRSCYPVHVLPCPR